MSRKRKRQPPGNLAPDAVEGVPQHGGDAGPQRLHRAARFIAGSWTSGRSYSALPHEADLLDSSDRQLGLAVHLQALAFSTEDRIAGYKVGSTSRTARDSMGHAYRPFGTIRASRSFDSGRHVQMIPTPDCFIEPEICLVIGHRLFGPNVSTAQARAAVSGAAPALEICQRRVALRTPPVALLLADGLHHWGLVCGPIVPVAGDLDDLDVRLTANGQLVSEARANRQIVDDPFVSLARVTATLAEFGLGLEPGHKVITGSLTPPTPVAATMSVVATFSDLGSVQVLIT